MVEAIRTVEKALGGVSYESGEHELGRRDYRHSLYIVQDVKKGEPLPLATSVLSGRAAVCIHVTIRTCPVKKPRRISRAAPR